MAMASDFDRSTALFDEALRAFRSAYRGESEAEAQTFLEKALMLIAADRAEDALIAARDGASLVDQNIETGPLTRAYANATLGLAAKAAGQNSLARIELTEALEAFSAVRGTSFDLAPGLLALGEIEMSEGRPGLAVVRFDAALEAYQEGGGNSSIGTGTALSRLSQAHLAANNFGEALQMSELAVQALRQRIEIGETLPWNDASIERKAGREILAQELNVLSKTSDLSEPASRSRFFSAVQLSGASRAGGAIAQLSSRLVPDDPDIAAQLRRRSDLAAEWRAIQDLLVGTLIQSDRPAIEQNKNVLLDRIGAIEAEIAELDAIIASLDPRLDLLLKTRISEAQRAKNALKDGEGLLALSVQDEATYGYFVAKHLELAFVVPIQSDEVAGMVADLRNSMTVDSDGFLPEFYAPAAVELYEKLFGPIREQLEQIDQLILVPDSSIGSLPIEVLLTDHPKEDDGYDAYPWLVKDIAVTIFPTVSSVVALRELEAERVKSGTFLGVGDPDFEGGYQDREVRGSVINSLTRSRLGDTSLIRGMPRLPDTRSEVIEIAGWFGMDKSMILLGSEANESELKQAQLADYSSILFATHALAAGEFFGYAEPAIVLSPPQDAAPSNDGLLSMSEIAELELDAEIVILSACNTAASDGTLNAEPLSGLAKAFFYAGARSVLASHWEVESASAALTTRRLFELLMQEGETTTALQAIKLEFIEGKFGDKSHPFFWAPFSLIGDGVLDLDQSDKLRH
jgi:CHAT domain-containing protein